MKNTLLKLFYLEQMCDALPSAEQGVRDEEYTLLHVDQNVAIPRMLNTYFDARHTKCIEVVPCIYTYTQREREKESTVFINDYE